MEYEKKKNSKMGIIMGTPALSKQMREAWYAPAGSTKRKQSKAAVRAILKIGQRKGVYDGQGGFTDAMKSLFMADPFARPTKGTTKARGSEIMQPQSQPFREYGSRYIEQIPNMVKQAVTAPLGGAAYRTGKALFSGEPGAADKQIIQELFFIKNIDEVFKPYEGIGEVLANDLGKHILGRNLNDTERRQYANMQAKEVRVKLVEQKRLQDKAKGTTTVTPSTVPMTHIPGTASTPGTPGVTDSSAIVPGAVSGTVSQETETTAKTMVERASEFKGPEHRAGYLESLDATSRPVAEKIFEYLDNGFSKEMVFGLIINDINTLKKMFPGVPENMLPIGSMSDSALSASQRAAELEKDMWNQWKNLNDMYARGQYLEDDLYDYVKMQDDYIGHFNKLIEREKDFRGAGRVLTDREQKNSDFYLNWITNMKGKQETRYIDWINKSINEYERSYNIASNMFDRTAAMLDRAIADKEKDIGQDYPMYKQYIDGMYDQLALMSNNATIRDAAMLEAMIKQNNSLATIGTYMSNLKKIAPEESYNKLADELGMEKSAFDETTNSLNFGLSDEQLKELSKDKAKISAYYAQQVDGKIVPGSISKYNPWTVAQEAADNGLHPTTTLKQYMSDSSNNIYNSAKEGYGMETYDLYDAGLRELKSSPDYYTNPDKQKVWEQMNTILNEQYIAGLRDRLSEDTTQRDAVAELIKRLAGVDMSTLMENGQFYDDAMQRLTNSLWTSDIGINKELFAQIFEFFKNKVYPNPAVYGLNAASYAIPQKDVFETKRGNQDMTNEEIVKSFLTRLLDYYKNGHLLVDHNAPYNFSVEEAASTLPDFSQSITTPEIMPSSTPSIIK